MVKTAVVLVAGVGSRLRPITDARPKALAPVGSSTILGRAIDVLQGFGIERFVLATGYREDAVKEALAPLRDRTVFCLNPEYATTQNSVSLALCRRQLEGAPFLKLDGDVVFEPAVIERLLASRAEIAAAVDASRRLDEEAMKVVVQGGRITRFGKGVPLTESHGESIGIELVSAQASTRLFDELDLQILSGRRNLYYEDVYSMLIESGRLTAEAVDVSGLRWTEVDTHEDLTRARELFGP